MAEAARQVFVALSPEHWTVHRGYIKSLQGARIDVITCDDIDEFVELSGEGAALLIIGTATGMAGVSGHELIERLAERSPRPEAPVLLLQDPRTPRSTPPTSPLTVLEKWSQARDVLGLSTSTSSNRASTAASAAPVKLQSKDPTIEMTAPRARRIPESPVDESAATASSVKGGDQFRNVKTLPNAVALSKSSGSPSVRRPSEPPPPASREDKPSYMPPPPPPPPLTDPNVVELAAADVVASSKPEAESPLTDGVVTQTAEVATTADQSAPPVGDGTSDDLSLADDDKTAEVVLSAAALSDAEMAAAIDAQADPFVSAPGASPVVTPTLEPSPVVDLSVHAPRPSESLPDKTEEMVAPPDFLRGRAEAGPSEHGETPSRTDEFIRQSSGQRKLIMLLCLLLGASLATSIILVVIFGGDEGEGATDPLVVVDADLPSVPTVDAAIAVAADTGEPDAATPLESLPDEVILPLRYDRHNEEPHTVNWQKMRAIIALLKRSPELHFDLIGHASPDELPRKADRLAFKRARGARDLICLKGPSRSRFEIHSAGSNEPLDHADGREVTEASRRVVLRLNRR